MRPKLAVIVAVSFSLAGGAYAVADAPAPSATETDRVDVEAGRINPDDDPKQIVCRGGNGTGSRLKRRSNEVCRTRQEWADLRRDAKETVRSMVERNGVSTDPITGMSK